MIYKLNLMWKTIIACALMLVVLPGNAQNVNGKITDNQNEAVSNAVVILRNRDTAFVQATTSDSLGRFSLQIDFASGFVSVQHLSFADHTVEFTNSNYSVLKNIVLTDKNTQLEAVTVKAGVQTVTVRDNALVFNAQHIAEQKSVTSAFELLKYVPGVSTRNDEISLTGASQLTVIIDGKATMLSNSEIAEMLKAMPASRIGDIEVMYRAPSKYGVKGSLINIVTDKSGNRTPVEAELATEYQQKFYASGNSRANIAFHGEKFDLDVLANAAYGKLRTDLYDYSINNFDDIKTIIDQESNSATGEGTKVFRTAMDLNFSNGNMLSLMYYGKEHKSADETESTANFLYHNGETNLVNSYNDEDSHSNLRNINLKGIFGGANITADYVLYRDEIETKYKDEESNSITTDYHYNSDRNIGQLKLLASYDWAISDNWQLSTGVQGTMTNSDTKLKYYFPKNGIYESDNNSNSDNTQIERRFSAFVETANTLFDSVQLDFTLELEYFKSDYDENGAKSTLWDEWKLYPSLSLMWPMKRDILQLSLSTYKNYPSYWDLSPHESQMNPYKFGLGNPKLKPSTNYNFNLAYLINKQYTLEAFCVYEKDAFRELPYQHQDTTTKQPRNNYQPVNFDFIINGGVGGEVPFCIGFWEPTLSGYLIYTRDKMSDFHGLAFDRDNFFVSLAFENTFSASDNLLFTLNTAYMSKSIQGIYDMNYGYTLELGMKWSITNNLTFTANWTDIFERWGPYPATVDFNGQYNKLDRKLYNCFNASLVWRIGGFNAKDVEMTNTERMER